MISHVARDPRANDQKLGVMSGLWRYNHMQLELVLFGRELVLVLLQGGPLG